LPLTVSALAIAWQRNPRELRMHNPLCDALSRRVPGA
jgi:hypothetical protein